MCSVAPCNRLCSNRALFLPAGVSGVDSAGKITALTTSEQLVALDTQASCLAPLAASPCLLGLALS